MRDVGAVVTVMVLDEDLRPDELGRWHELDRGTEQRRLWRVDEPLVGNMGGDRRHVGDDVDEQLAAGDAIEPAFIDNLDVEPVLLEIVEHFQRVAGLGEHVDVLGRPVDAGVAR